MSNSTTFTNAEPSLSKPSPARTAAHHRGGSPYGTEEQPQFTPLYKSHVPRQGMSNEQPTNQDLLPQWEGGASGDKYNGNKIKKKRRKASKASDV
ncbi:hypothetical protein MKZ38_006494 [Zalerion maritima]|uniref:Uncharacterized protein n=1 Tax=Zalerion maritima TaxID=339359 RepID=A0AAD5RZ15_9PEZI|nr:hypothetical protein MKZ38_006494 [Zalerion maritima]